METFTEIKDFVDNPGFTIQRSAALADLDLNSIDKPISGLIKDLASLPYCFTLQSCCGHFVHKINRDPYNLDRLPDTGIVKNVEYRIAYIALCIKDSSPGRRLFEDLRKVPDIDSEYVQFGCADWFWNRQVNSYALQVEPLRFSMEDRAVIGYGEALHLEKIRDLFFKKLDDIVRGLRKV